MNGSDRYYNDILKSGYTYITAHTGCEGTMWNSIEHIEAALKSGAEVIEVDIHKHGDLLYLSHDEAEQPESRPTLRRCFEMIEPDKKILLNCDVKHFGLVQPVVELAGEMGMAERIHFTGQVSKEDAQYLKSSNAIAGWWNSIFPSSQNMVKIREAIGFMETYNRDKILCVEYHMITDELLDYVKKNGYAFTVWTVDEDEDLKRMFGLGLVNITTKRPVRALEIRKSILGY